MDNILKALQKTMRAEAQKDDNVKRWLKDMNERKLWTLSHLQKISKCSKASQFAKLYETADGEEALSQAAWVVIQSRVQEALSNTKKNTKKRDHPSSGNNDNNSPPAKKQKTVTAKKRTVEKATSKQGISP